MQSESQTDQSSSRNDEKEIISSLETQNDSSYHYEFDYKASPIAIKESIPEGTRDPDAPYIVKVTSDGFFTIHLPKDETLDVRRLNDT